MKKAVNLLLFLVFLVTYVASSQCASSAPIQQTPVPQTTRLLPVAAEIGQKLQDLVVGNGIVEAEPQDTFGTRALGLIITFFEGIGNQVKAFANNFSILTQVEEWLVQQFSDPVLLERWGLIWQSLLVVVGSAFIAGWLADLFLLPLRRHLNRRQPATLAARFSVIFGWMCLSLVPVILFLGTALALLDQGEPQKIVRLVVMTVVYALSVLRLIQVFVRFFLAPKLPALRLIPVNTSQATFLQRWISAFSYVTVLGYYSIDVARLVKFPAQAISLFSSFIGLVVVVMAVSIIIKKRAFVSTFLRGDLSVARPRLTFSQSLRLWLARSWHVWAILYLVVGYIVTTLGGEGGFAGMQIGTILTLVVLTAARMAFYLIARLKYRRQEDDSTSGIYRPVLHFILRFATWGLAIAGVAWAWGVDVPALLATPWGQRIMGSLFSITSTVVLVVFIYELLHAYIERKLNRRDAEGNIIEANSRARTLLPMVHNAAIVVLVVIVGLVTLSELGVNTAPLLAGAGVLGVAVGFGSQTLIKDFLTGLFIVIENTIAVGDTVTIGGHTGVVEGMTIRTARLRDAHGDLHILPFSEITSLINKTKDFSFALVDVGVAYDSDIRKVMAVMQKVGDELRLDPVLQEFILEPTEIMGIEQFADSSIIMRGRIKTKAGKQGEVKRAFMLRIKEAFDAEKIEIPFPTVMQVRKAES